MKALIVVDMQNDFITGRLGSKEAKEIADRVASKIEDFDGLLITTFDTHDEHYFETQEGQLLHIPHCLIGTDGWQLTDAVLEAVRKCHFAEYKEFYKNRFASLEMANYLANNLKNFQVDEVEIVGVCTDICVVSNALLLKTYLPETRIVVDASCCAGTSAERHNAALETMRSCQIIVDGEA